MKLIILLVGACASLPSFARSLDRARVLAARIEAKIPVVAPLLCAECDGEWSENGEPLRRLEAVLASVLADPRAQTIESTERLGTLMAEHFSMMLKETAGDKAPAMTGKTMLCTLSKAPCELFSPKVFADFCTPPEGH